MNHASGTYRAGKVVLDEPVDWPDGTQVKIECQNGADTSARDMCANDLRWDDTPEAKQKWAEWFDALEPVFTGEELAKFEKALRATRQEQEALSATWQERIDHLLE